jgi:hypothetical protein
MSWIYEAYLYSPSSFKLQVADRLPVVRLFPLPFIRDVRLEVFYCQAEQTFFVLLIIL